MPLDTETAAPTLSDADKKRFASELLKRLQKIPDEEQQQWYFSLVASALDQTEGDIDKALEVADKALVMEQPPANEPQTKALEKSLPGFPGSLVWRYFPPGGTSYQIDLDSETTSSTRSHRAYWRTVTPSMPSRFGPSPIYSITQRGSSRWVLAEFRSGQISEGRDVDRLKAQAQQLFNKWLQQAARNEKSLLGRLRKSLPALSQPKRADELRRS